MTAKRRNKVTRGNRHLTVYRWTHPSTGKKGWRFAFQEDGKWKYRTHATKEEAEIAAGRILDQQPQGLVWDGLDVESRRFLEEIHRRVSPGDRPAVLAYLRSRDTSAEIGAAVAAFIAHKRTEAGELTPHLRTVQKLLEEAAAHFTGRRVSEIHSPELAAWWTERSAGRSGKTAKDIRGHLVSFWRWAQMQGIAGADPITAAERLPISRAADGEKRVLTPAELSDILAHVREDCRAWAILAAFAGMRPEEIAPKPGKGRKAGKRGLHCEEIDWQFSCIHLPAIVSKGGKRSRQIPMSEALRVGLEWAGIREGMTGPIYADNRQIAIEINRLGKLLFAGKWPQDALRHSYGSYRNAILRNLPQVAEEMGNSVTMLHKHYHRPMHESIGLEWFAVRPPETSQKIKSL